MLDEDLDPDFVGEIRQFIEGLVEAGFRRRLISLIKVGVFLNFILTKRQYFFSTSEHTSPELDLKK